MTRFQRVIADRYLVPGTGYLNRSGSEAGVGNAIVEFEHTIRQGSERFNKIGTSTHQPEADSQLELTIDLGDRAQSDSQEAGHISGASATGAFRDIRSNGHRRRPHLRSESKPLIRREVGRNSVDLLGDVETVMPYLKSPKVVHSEITNGAQRRFTPLWSKYPVPSTKYRLFIGSSR